MSPSTIGFIGQGYVGKNYADNFEQRGMAVVRYALEEPYCKNKEAIAQCDVVIVAVPTPTVRGVSDTSIVASVVELTKENATVILKSTVLPGSTNKIQGLFPDRIIFFSPEFLVERTAAKDAAHPIMNIIGYVRAPDRERAQEMLGLFPTSPHNAVMQAEEAELIKYAHNVHGYMRIVFTNLLFEASQSLGVAWEPIRDAMNADPMLSPYYNDPVHKSGRGAGGRCFIKDFAAFSRWYQTLGLDEKDSAVFRALEEKNLSLLKESNKDQDIVREVYGTSN